VPGELHLGGRCPADGYINDPDRSAALFLPDRFAGTGTMYRTGDQVLRDEHGALVFLGRDDTQVKVRGYRIELGELEAVANAAPGVRRAIAVARGGGADRELVLFVLAAEGTTVDHDALTARMRQALPAYMVPARIFDLDSVPVTGAGKTDRDALAARADGLAGQAPEGADGEAGYADDLERELAELWAQVLGVPRIRRDRSVLDYGAHSLNVVTVLAEVGELYGIAPPITEFLRSPTVATLAGLVRAALAAAAPGDA
jgi:acyl carrier protein